MVLQESRYAMRGAVLILIGIAILLIGADAPGQEKEKVPEGVIYVKLPPGEVRIEQVEGKGKYLYRVSAGKAVVEAKTFFFGNEKGAVHFQPIKKTTGYVEVHGPGSSFNFEEYQELSKLKAGSLYVTTPSITFGWGKDAKGTSAVPPGPPNRDKAAKNAKANEGAKELQLPEGVFHVKLPPGTVRMKQIAINGRFLIRMEVGKTIIQSHRLFLGDQKGATQLEAVTDGIHRVITNGRRGEVFASMMEAPGSSTFMETGYVRPNQMKAGNIWVTTPSLVFKWGEEATREIEKLRK